MTWAFLQQRQRFGISLDNRHINAYIVRLMRTLAFVYALSFRIFVVNITLPFRFQANEWLEELDALLVLTAKHLCFSTFYKNV